MTTPPAPVRAFGRAASDLDVAFGPRPADETATALLARCVACDDGIVRDWTLARRLQALLAVRLADDPDARAPAVLRCGACGDGFELEIDLARCVVPVDESPLAWASPEGHALVLRLPRARDLEAWRATGRRGETEMAAALVDTIDGQPPTPAFEMPTAWTEALADMLAERDPFTALQVDAPCPDCGHVNPAEVDLEALLLADFAACQRRLLEEVTLLARSFHWSEAQILDLPAWRRAHYIARLDAMGAA